MPQTLKLHIAYAADDVPSFGELHQHLSALTRSYSLLLSHSAEFVSSEEELASAVLREADFILLLITPKFALKRRPLIEQLRQIAPKKAGRGRLHLASRIVPIFLEVTAWPYAARHEGLPDRSSIAEYPSRELGWFEVVRGLRAILDRAREGGAESRTEDRGLMQKSPPPLAVKLTGLPRIRYALLVGVNRFLDGRAFPSLRYCINDVRVLRETLDAQGYLVRLIHDEMDELPLKPLRENVLYHLDDICSRAQADDLVLVHFACHGFLHEQRQYLAVYDTRHNRAAQSGLALSEIEARLRRCPARRQILILDACHSGAALIRGEDEEAFIRSVFERAEGFVRIAASTAQQKAQEWQEKQMGAFSYFLNEALRGKAKNQHQFVTVQSVASYVLHKMRKWTFENLGREQEPTIQYEGLGEIVLADYREAPPT